MRTPRRMVKGEHRTGGMKSRSLDRKTLAKRAEDFELRRREIRRLRAKVVRSVENDKDFVIARERLVRVLREIRKHAPEAFETFFSCWPRAQVISRKLEQFLKSVSPTSRAAFEDHVRFVARFGVALIPQRNGFRTIGVRISAQRLEGVIRRGVWQARESVGADVFPDDVLAPNLVLPPGLDKLVKQRLAKAVYLDETDGRSLLRMLEQFAYDPEMITFVVHRIVGQAFLFCLVGELVSTGDWKRAALGMSAIHKVDIGRSKAGRRTNVSRFLKAIEARKAVNDTTVLKELVPTVGVSVESTVESQQSYMSRVERVIARAKPRQTQMNPTKSRPD